MIRLDVCSDESVGQCVEHVLNAAGAVDVLVNNAGYLLAGAVEEASLAEVKAQFETNFFGVVRMVRAVVPLMRTQRSGHILTVSSLAGIVPVPFWAYYNASKFAVEGLMESLRYEVTPFGIHVSMVEPGAIRTPFYAQPHAAALSEYAPWRERALNTMKQFENRAPGPEVVGDRVAQILAQRQPSLRNPITLEGAVLPFIRRMLPARMNEWGVRKTFKLN